MAFPANQFINSFHFDSEKVLVITGGIRKYWFSFLLYKLNRFLFRLFDCFITFWILFNNIIIFRGWKNSWKFNLSHSVIYIRSLIYSLVFKIPRRIRIICMYISLIIIFFAFFLWANGKRIVTSDENLQKCDSNCVYMQSVANNLKKAQPHDKRREAQKEEEEKKGKQWNCKNSIKLEYHLCFVLNVFDPWTRTNIAIWMAEVKAMLTHRFDFFF